MRREWDLLLEFGRVVKRSEKAKCISWCPFESQLECALDILMRSLTTMWAQVDRRLPFGRSTQSWLCCGLEGGGASSEGQSIIYDFRVVDSDFLLPLPESISHRTERTVDIGSPRATAAVDRVDDEQKIDLMTTVFMGYKRRHRNQAIWARFIKTLRLKRRTTRLQSAISISVFSIEKKANKYEHCG